MGISSYVMVSLLAHNGETASAELRGTDDLDATEHYVNFCCQMLYFSIAAVGRNILPTWFAFSVQTMINYLSFYIVNGLRLDETLECTTIKNSWVI
jgi:hypothetical protein